MSTAENDGSQPSAGVTPPNGGDSANPAAGVSPNPPQEGESEDGQGRNWRNLRSDRDYWRDRAAQLEQAPRGEAPPPRSATPPVSTDAESSKKTLADFAFDEAKYDDYLATRTREEARRAARAEIDADNERKNSEVRRSNFETKQAEFAKTNPTYFEAVRNPRFVQSDTLIAEIMESDEGPAIAQHLANNIDLTNRLNRMNAVGVAREVVRLEAKVKSERERATASRNQLPGADDPPPNPPPKIEGAGDAGVKKDPAKMSDDEWWKSRERSNKRKR